jgi:hypothetical protein
MHEFCVVVQAPSTPQPLCIEGVTLEEGGVSRGIHHRTPRTVGSEEPTSAATVRASVAYEVSAPFSQSRGLYEQRDQADPTHPRQHEGRAKCRLRHETCNSPCDARSHALSELPDWRSTDVS